MWKDNEYLTGLFEGDGHLYMLKDTNPRFCLTTHEKNEPWLLAIKQDSFNNYGFIRRKRKERALVLTISNKAGLYLIATKLNGCFKTPKIEVFNKLIDWLNIHYIPTINCTPLEHKPINYDLNNPWLTGFIEADGGFYIRFSEPKISSGKSPRIGARFSLEQRMFSNSNITYKLIMDKITQHLEGKLYTITRLNGNSYYNITLNSIKNTKILVEYLEKYPLCSTKYLDYLNWKQVVMLIQTKEHLKKENLDNIKYLKRNMNNSRTKYSWLHLQ